MSARTTKPRRSGAPAAPPKSTPKLQKRRPDGSSSSGSSSSSRHRANHAGISSGAIPRGHDPSFTLARTDRGIMARLSGREFVSPITMTTANDVAGGILFNQSNTPIMPNTRLTQFAEIYQRWFPVKYRYHFVSSLPTTQKGTFVYAHDPDPLADWTVIAATNINRARTLTGSAMQQGWMNASSTLPDEGDYTDLWTHPATGSLADPEDRLSAAGQFVIINTAPSGIANNTIIGMLELEYTIDFHLPRLSSNDGGDSLDIVLPVAEFVDDGSGFGAYVLSTVMTTATALALAGVKFASSKIMQALREHDEYVPALVAGKRHAIKKPGSRLTALSPGCGRGYYSVKLAVYYDSGPTLDNWGLIKAPITEGVVRVLPGAGYALPASWAVGDYRLMSGDPGFVDYAGGVHTYCAVFNFDCSIDSIRGICDQELVLPNQTAHPGTLPVRIEARLSLNPENIFYTASSNRAIPKAAIVIPPASGPPEVKEITDPSPPAFVPAPSAVPGTPHYTAIVEPLAKPAPRTPGAPAGSLRVHSGK